MADPFVTALGVLLNGPGSVAAIYTPAGSTGTPIRVIRGQPSEISSLGIGKHVVDTNELMIACADIALPAEGDTIQIGSSTLTILADPLLDAEGISWIVQAAEAPQ